MKCLVTGATGFIGTNLVHELVKEGWDVRAFGLPHSNATYINELPVEIVYGDITNYKEIETAVCNCDIVFHVAGENISYHNLFQTIAQKFDKNAPRFIMPKSILIAYGYMMQTLSMITNKAPDVDPGVANYMSVNAFYDSSKAVNDLNYKIIPVQQMVDDAYHWYIDNGFLHPE